MTIYAPHVSRKKTAQNQPIPGSTQVQNSAGGFSWGVDCWTKLDRFLVLGNEGGSYYASEREQTIKASDAITECLKLDPYRTIRRIIEISDGGRAPKNAPAVFALAQCVGAGAPVTVENLCAVCRIATDLFAFVASIKEFRGWGRSLRSLVASWYNSKPTDKLALQMAKYQNRNGWTHKDVLRLSHPKGDEAHNALYRWAVGKDANLPEEAVAITAMQRAMVATNEREIVSLIEQYDLPRECIPTDYLNSPAVWDALLQKMPPTAMIRNLGKMSSIGLLSPLSNASKLVCDKLGNVDVLRKARIHPMTLLIAQKIYESGHGLKGSLTWTTVPSVVDALNGAFYKAFKTVEPTGKRWLLALDVSGSMTCGTIAGSSMTPREGSVAMALVTANVEDQFHMVVFSDDIKSLPLSPTQRLTDAVRTIGDLPFSATDCALPMTYAAQNKIPVDVFAIYTDSETWYGGIHPMQALREYRQKMGIDAKLIVCGMVSNGFTIADPEDKGALDVVGFDSSCPQIMSQFVTG